MKPSSLSRGLGAAALLLALSPLAGRAEGLDLPTARRLAEEGSGALAAARSRAAELEAAVVEARARGLPRLGLTATGSWLANPPAGITIPAGAFNSAAFPPPPLIPAAPLVFVEDAEPSYFKLGASLEQLLYSWGKVRLGVEASRLGAEAAGQDARAGLVELRRDVGRAFAGALLAREALPLLREIEALLAGALADSEEAFSAGAAARVEVLEARARLAQAAARRSTVEEGLATALEALAFYTGRRLSAEELAGGLPSAPPALDEGLLLRAYRAGPEFAALGARSRQAGVGEEAAKAALAGLPDFFLKADLNYEGQGLPGADSAWRDKYDWGLTLTLGGRVELFDSFASRSRLSQAALRRQAAESGLEELERSAALRLRRLLEAIRSAAAELAAGEASLELAREKARNATSAYDNELATRGEERGARALALGAELELLSARLRLEEALLELEAFSALELPRPPG